MTINIYYKVEFGIGMLVLTKFNSSKFNVYINNSCVQIIVIINLMEYFGITPCRYRDLKKTYSYN